MLVSKIKLQLQYYTFIKVKILFLKPSIEIKLFSIRCDINQAIKVSNAKNIIIITNTCYESRLKGLSPETTLVLSNTRELNRVPNTK